MGAEQISPNTSTEPIRTFSYRGKPWDDFANVVAILGASVAFPLLSHWKVRDTRWSPWVVLVAVFLVLGAVGEAAKGWRRLQDIRRRRERGETISARAEGLVFEDRTSFVDVPWDMVTSYGQLDRLCLVKTIRGVIAFTHDLWGWQDLWKLIAQNAGRAVSIMPEEASAAAESIDYPASPPG